MDEGDTIFGDMKVIMKRLSKGSTKVFTITTPRSYFDGVQGPDGWSGKP